MCDDEPTASEVAHDIIENSDESFVYGVSHQTDGSQVRSVGCGNPSVTHAAAFLVMRLARSNDEPAEAVAMRVAALSNKMARQTAFEMEMGLDDE